MFIEMLATVIFFKLKKKKKKKELKKAGNSIKLQFLPTFLLFYPLMETYQLSNPLNIIRDH
jgi:hypothetical protein